MEDSHQLIDSFSHYRVLYIPGDVGFLPSTVGVRMPIRPGRPVGSFRATWSSLVFVPGKRQQVKWFSLFFVTPETWGIDLIL